jgi:hypothetical protein
MLHRPGDALVFFAFIPQLFERNSPPLRFIAPEELAGPPLNFVANQIEFALLIVAELAPFLKTQQRPQPPGFFVIE